MSAGYGSESGQEREKEELHATRTGEEGLLGNFTLLVYIPKGSHFGKGHFAAS